jgi:hypothetical protein
LRKDVLKTGSYNDKQCKQDLKGLAMIRKTMITAFVLVCAVWATTPAAQDSTKVPDTAKAREAIKAVDASRLDGLEQKVRAVIDKAGISFGGEFRSQFLTSAASGNAVAKSFRKQEDVEFTSVDFDVSARPASELQARLIFRFYEDWRNLWNTFQDPICARWISVDGLAKNMFGYDVGDFRQKYSPLTLYSPDVDISYEPEIFTQQRKYVMQEMFLGDNERVLQGVNLNFDAEITPVFKEFHLNVLGSRLRTVEGAQTGQPVAGFLDTALMDKYLFGTNLNMVILSDLGVGGSFLDIFDATPTYGGSIDSAAVLQQNTRVFAGRGSIGSGLFADRKIFNLALNGEVAVSSNDSSWHHVDTISSTLVSKSLETESITGLAAAVDLKGFLRLGASGNLNLDLGYLNNGPDFRNELAQSPTFFRTRIMNSENDLTTKALYSTFDGLYRQVFKFSPSENAQNAGALAGWLKGPTSKIAYGNGILTQKEMRSVPLDNSISLVMPFGPATANRSGVKADVSGDFLERAVMASVSAKYLSEIDGQRVVLDSSAGVSAILPATSFLEAGGGLSVDIAAIGHWWKYPLLLSGGYTMSTATNDGVTGYAASPWDISVGFANAGLYWTVLKRTSLLGGFQYLKTTGDGVHDNVKHSVTQIHYSLGLEFKVSAGGTITGSVGNITVTHGNDAGTDESSKDFQQWQSELFLTATF